MKQPFICYACLITAVTGIVATSAGCASSQAEAETPLTEEQQAAAEEQANEPVGKSLGEFVLRDFHPIEGVRTTLKFELFAQVRRADAAEFESLLLNRFHSVRNNVITATRTAPMDEFDDPNLVMVRQRILARLRRFLPEMPLKDVVITEFSYTIDE